HILNCDHRLVGEGRCKFDLFVVERPHYFARQYDNADRHSFAQERHAEHGAKLAEPWGLGQRILWIVLNVMYVNGVAFKYHPASYGPGSWHNRVLSHKFLEFRRVPVVRYKNIGVSLRTIYAYAIGIAEARR